MASTVIVWGRHDVLMPLALGERLVAGITAAESVVCDDCAHSPNIEEADRFNALLLDCPSDTRGHAARAAAPLAAGT